MTYFSTGKIQRHSVGNSLLVTPWQVLLGVKDRFSSLLVKFQKFRCVRSIGVTAKAFRELKRRTVELRQKKWSSSGVAVVSGPVLRADLRTVCAWLVTMSQVQPGACM